MLDLVSIKRRIERTPLSPLLALVLRCMPQPAKNSLRRRVLRKALRPSDVFLVGHPRSGNTWLAFMLAILKCGPDADAVTLANVGAYVPVVHGKGWEIANYPDLPDPRIFRNEWPKFPELFPRTIYLIRDPRAVLVSLYHMYQVIFDDQNTNVGEFLDEYLTHGCIRKWEPQLERWDRQVLRWIERSREDNCVMIVNYSEMVENRREALRRIARFIGLEVTQEDLNTAVARGSLQSMRESERRYGAESYTPEQSRRGRFVRKGKIDSWTDELDPALAEQIVETFKPAMLAAGYSA